MPGQVKAVRRRLWFRIQSPIQRDEPPDSKLRLGGAAAALVGLRSSSSRPSAARKPPNARNGASAKEKRHRAPMWTGALASKWAARTARGGRKISVNEAAAPLLGYVPLTNDCDASSSEDEEEQVTPPWLIGRPECETELESRFSKGAVPFESWDIFASESSSVCVGSLKALVRVVRHEADAPLGLPASLGALLSPSRYTIRLYVLRAEHLVPGDTCGTSDAYLKINCGEFAASTRARCKDRVTDADFFELFELSALLPGESELEISVMDADTLGSDDLIGKTTIDLEDRLFNREWSALHPKPLEWRSLRSPTSNAPQGRISLWVDAFLADMPSAGVSSDLLPPPKWDISPPELQRWELRVIIWRTAEVLPHDMLTSMNDLYASVRYASAEEQRTDTHWRCNDGAASFNWRCVWRVSLGHRRKINERLRLQLWDRDLLKYNDSIGEVVVPLGPLFGRAYRERARAASSAAAIAAGATSNVALASSDEDSSDVESGLRARSIHGSGLTQHRAPPSYTGAALTGLHLESDPSIRPPSERSLRAIISRLWSEAGPPAEGVGGKLPRVWLPVLAKSGVSGASDVTGYVQISVELVPEEVADAHPVGLGRSEPNAMPELPPPAGRFHLSLNPIANCYNILGPTLCASLSCAACGLISAFLSVLLVVQMVPVVAANLVTEILVP